MPWSTGWSRRLELTLRFTHPDTSRHWIDDDQHQLEDQLPEAVKAIEEYVAQVKWDEQEAERRRVLREERWARVRAEAWEGVRDDRWAAQLDDELTRRAGAAAMRTYADEVEIVAATLSGEPATHAMEWAAWIRAHADRIDPLHQPLAEGAVENVTHEELGRHMHGWSAHGPYRNTPQTFGRL